MPQSPEQEDSPNVEIPIPVSDEITIKVDVGVSDDQPVVDGGSIDVTLKF